jgi:hypothetical protein
MRTLVASAMVLSKSTSVLAQLQLIAKKAAQLSMMGLDRQNLFCRLVELG